MKEFFQKENLVKFGVGLLAILIVVALFVLISSRDTTENGGPTGQRSDDVLSSEEIPFYEQYENMDLAEIGSYRFDVRVTEPDYSATFMATNYRNQQLRVHALSTLIPDEDGEDVNGDLIYSMDEEILYLEDEDGSYSRFNTDFPFTNSEIFLQGIDNILSVDLIEGDEEDVFAQKIYEVVFTKEFFNQMIEYTNANITATEDVTGFVTIDGDYVFRISFDHPDVVVEAAYYALGSGSFTEIR